MIGLSGGADSVFLSVFLKRLAGEWGLSLGAVHINHGIRGAEADRDEAFCLQLAEELDIPLSVVRADIPQIAREQGLSQEEAGRDLRYQWMEKLRQEGDYHKIAVAHHRNDQAETVLLQLLRGSSLRGLGGMRPVRDRVIRPLLETERGELEEQLRQQGISWCIDSTNLQDGYTRNRLRNQLLPLLEEYAGGRAVEHLCRTARLLQEDYDYIRCGMEEAWEELIEVGEAGQDPGGGVWRPEAGCGKRIDRFCRVSLDAFHRLPVALQRELLLEMMAYIGESRKDLGFRHVESVLELSRGNANKKLELPYQMAAGRDYDFLWLGRYQVIEEEPGNPGDQEKYCWDPGESGEKEFVLPGNGGRDIKIALQCEEEGVWEKEALKNDCTKWFDCARINCMLEFRYPRQGDYFQLSETGGRKKLSRFLMEAKILPERRKKVWVLAAGSHILWIPELGRTSAAFYVNEDTRTVLCARYELL